MEFPTRRLRRGHAALLRICWPGVLVAAAVGVVFGGLCSGCGGSGRPHAVQSEQLGGASEGVAYAAHFRFSAERDTLFLRSESGAEEAWVQRGPADGPSDARSAAVAGSGVTVQGVQVGDPVATWSTTHAPFLRALGVEGEWCAAGYRHRIIGLTEERLATLYDLGGDGGLDEETLVMSGAGVLTSYPFGDPMEGVFARTGIPVMALREYAEQHPLGRAEYIKVFGWLTGRLERADSLFDALAERYVTASARGEVEARVHGRPVVFTGSEQGGFWTAPTGDALVAQLVTDAGGAYLIDVETEREMGLRREGRNVTLAKEQFVRLAAGADAWGKVVHAPSGWYRDDAVAALPWLSLDDKVLFHCNTAETDYFGSAILEPDRMLVDLLAILHGVEAPAPHYFMRTPHRP